MKKCNLKQIIKECIISLVRESDGPSKLFGHRIQLKWEDQLVPALISRNTRPGEQAYRVTWFTKDKEGNLYPKNHIDFGKSDLVYILTNKKFPDYIFPFFNLDTPEIVFE